VYLSAAALLGTLAMPPLPEATGQGQRKKKRRAAKKKADRAKKCPLQFAPGAARKPQRICS
jgi:hypothetical protein